MKLIGNKDQNITIQLSTIELALLNNALNESFEHLEDWEYSIRMGGSKEEAKILLKSIGSLLKP